MMTPPQQLPPPGRSILHSEHFFVVLDCEIIDLIIIEWRIGDNAVIPPSRSLSLSLSL